MKHTTIRVSNIPDKTNTVDVNSLYTPAEETLSHVTNTDWFVRDTPVPYHFLPKEVKIPPILSVHRAVHVLHASTSQTS